MSALIYNNLDVLNNNDLPEVTKVSPVFTYFHICKSETVLQCSFKTHSCRVKPSERAKETHFEWHLTTVKNITANKKTDQPRSRLRQSVSGSGLVPLSEVQRLFDLWACIMGRLFWAYCLGLVIVGFVMAKGQILRQILAPGNTLWQVFMAL